MSRRVAAAGASAQTRKVPLKLRFLPLLILLMPLIEIAGFVVVGSQIGVLATIGLVIASAVLGAVLLRVQGLGVVQRIRLAMLEKRTPGRELVHGAMIVLAALLLIVPGFVSDLFGLLLFVPAVREAVFRFLARHVTVITPAGPARSGRRGPSPRQIDLDEEEFRRTADPDGSPWRGRQP